jgi:hypothetical protein
MADAVKCVRILADSTNRLCLFLSQQRSQMKAEDAALSDEATQFSANKDQPFAQRVPELLSGGKAAALWR